MKKYIVPVILMIAAVAIFSFLFQPSKAEQALLDQKWDDCVEKTNQEIPDANDTEARASSLQECYEG